MDTQNPVFPPSNSASNNPAQVRQAEFAQKVQHSKPLVAIVAVLAVTVMALGAALVVNKSSAQQTAAANLPVVASTVPAPAAVGAPVSQLAETPRPIRTAPVTQSTQSHQVPQSLQPKPQYVAQAPTNVCLSCGTVEGVTAVQRQGQVNGVAVGNTTIGLGTVAGGLLGGLLGHQVGGGNGRTAMAVLGAAGGAYAGNAVEKNMKKVTVYDVRVRMDNGTTRNMEISSAVPVGSRVTVEGKNLRLASHNG